MSSMNEPFKEAEATQQTRKPAKPSLEFRPAQSTHPRIAPRGPELLLPWAIAGCALLALIIVCHLLQQKNEPRVVEAKGRVAASVDAASSSARDTADPDEVNAAAALALKAKLSATNAPVAAPATNVTAKPAPPPIRLQAIFYDPHHPGAMINGYTLYVGDRVGGLRIARITQTGVILVGAGRTNRLELPPR